MRKLILFFALPLIATSAIAQRSLSEINEELWNVNYVDKCTPIGSEVDNIKVCAYELGQPLIKGKVTPRSIAASYKKLAGMAGSAGNAALSQQLNDIHNYLYNNYGSDTNATQRFSSMLAPYAPTEKQKKKLIADRQKRASEILSEDIKAQRVNDLPVATTPAQQQGGRVIGQAFDNEVNANFFLYDGACRIANYSSSYPYRFDAKKVDSGENLGEGCYSFNQQSQQVFLMASTGKTATLSMSAFQGGGANQSSGGNAFTNFIGALTNGLNAANNVANPPNRPVTNLTPGLTQGRQIQVPQPNFNTPINKQTNCTTTYFNGMANTTCN